MLLDVDREQLSVPPVKRKGRLTTTYCRLSARLAVVNRPYKCFT